MKVYRLLNGTENDWHPSEEGLFATPEAAKAHAQRKLDVYNSYEADSGTETVIVKRLVWEFIPRRRPLQGTEHVAIYGLEDGSRFILREVEVYS